MKKAYGITEENISEIVASLKKKIKLANKGKEKGLYVVIHIPKKYRKNPTKYLELISTYSQINDHK